MAAPYSPAVCAYLLHMRKQPGGALASESIACMVRTQRSWRPGDLLSTATVADPVSSASLRVRRAVINTGV